eukprot:6132167-Pleurochrysis_carterae.AAC.2
MEAASEGPPALQAQEMIESMFRHSAMSGGRLAPFSSREERVRLLQGDVPSAIKAHGGEHALKHPNLVFTVDKLCLAVACSPKHRLPMLSRYREVGLVLVAVPPEADLDIVVAMLIKKSAESNGFICAEADRALQVLLPSGTHAHARTSNRMRKRPNARTRAHALDREGSRTRAGAHARARIRACWHASSNASAASESHAPASARASDYMLTSISCTFGLISLQAMVQSVSEVKAISALSPCISHRALRCCVCTTSPYL